MKRLLKSKLELALLFSLALMIFLMVVFFHNVLTGISLFIYSQIIPYNVVFSPGIDLKQYDGSVILNCLHGGGCPEGVTYVNDDTGLVEEREIVPKTAQPVNYPNTGQVLVPEFPPDSVQSSVANADLIVYFVYALILVSLVVVVIFLLKRRKNLKTK